MKFEFKFVFVFGRFLRAHAFGPIAELGTAWSFIKASFEFMSSLWTHAESRQAGITRSSIMICMMFYNQQITKLPHDVEVHFTMALRSLGLDRVSLIVLGGALLLVQGMPSRSWAQE